MRRIRSSEPEALLSRFAAINNRGDGATGARASNQRDLDKPIPVGDACEALMNRYSFQLLHPARLTQLVECVTSMLCNHEVASSNLAVSISFLSF